MTTKKLIALLKAAVSVAHDPVRYTDTELVELVKVWDGLLDGSPDIHLSAPEFFTYHQQLLLEIDRRSELAAEPAEPESFVGPIDV